MVLGVHFGVYAGGRAEHAVGFYQFVAERFPGLAGGGAVGDGAAQPVGGRAIGGALRGLRRGPLRRGCGSRRGLRDRGA